MLWFDRLAKKIKERNLPLEWVDDMKTPSGRIHVGSLRGVIIHDVVYKALKEIGVTAEFSYVFNDMDPMDGLPVYLDKNKYLPHMGKPLYKIPSPDKNYSNYAEYFAQEFIEVFNKLNCHPKIIRSSGLYQKGKMDEVVKIVLNNVDKIRDIYFRVTKKNPGENWYPYNPICQKCGKIGTTDVYRWDGKYVYYRCLPYKVEWAKGCGYEGYVEPIGDNGKLVWKVDWPAHWKVIGITIESSGKDHMSSGGSYDIASHIAKEVFNYSPPEAFGGYEWFTIGGKKMSSSKGVGSSAKEVSEILPPQVFRFLFVRTPITTHIDFDPKKEILFNLFDDYDRCLNAYFDKQEGKIPQGKPGEVLADFARIIELSKISDLPKKRIYLPRFRTIFNLLIQKKDDFLSFFEKLKKDKLSAEEKEILQERIFYAKKLIEREGAVIVRDYKNHQFTLSSEQKDFLKKLASNLKKLDNPTTEEIQQTILATLKENHYSPKEVFQGFYYVLTGKTYGPKAVDLIISLTVEKTIKVIEEKI
ncbi:MAG: lysine--tRNA ligase [Microgenomates group bacterium]